MKMEKHIIFKNFLAILYKRIVVLSMLTISLILVSMTLMFSFMNMNSNYAAVIQRHNELQQEDFQFMLKDTAVSLNNSELIKEAYEIDKIDIHQSKYFEQEGTKVRIVMLTNAINKLNLIAGELPQNGDEVVIEYNVAMSRGYAIGELFTFKNSQYRIVGFSEYPNLVNPNMSQLSYANFSGEKDILLSFSDNVYHSLNLSEKKYYVGKGEITTKLLEDSLYVLEKTSNTELNSVESQKVVFTTALGISTIVLFTIMIVMILLVIYKIISENINQIGILLSFGYKKIQLMVQLVLAVSSYLVAIFISLGISEVIQKNIFIFFNGNNLVNYPNIMTFRLNMIIAITICVVLIVFMLSYTGLLLSGKSIVAMVHNSGKNNISNFKKRIFSLGFNNNGAKIKKKFTLSSLIICFLLFFAGFSIIVQMMFSFGMLSYTNKVKQGLEKSANYDIAYNIIGSERASIENGQFFYSQQIKMENEIFNLVTLQNTDSEKIVFSEKLVNVDGAIVNRWIANKFSLKKDDIVNLMTTDGEYLQVKIGLVEDEIFFGKDIYISEAYHLAKVAAEIKFNGLYASDSVDIGSLAVISEMNKNDVFNNAKKNSELLTVVSFIMIALGLIIGALIIFISLDILMKNNENNILIFKVLGYTDIQIYNMLITPQIIFVLIGTFIAVPYFNMLNNVLFSGLSKSSLIYYDFSVDLIQIGLILIGATAFFMLISIFYFGKIVRQKNIGVLMSDV
ncbi:MAG: FtsX-like permease family protein [Culicoidibacterales bacterium]